METQTKQIVYVVYVRTKLPADFAQRSQEQQAQVQKSMQICQQLMLQVPVPIQQVTRLVEIDSVPLSLKHPPQRRLKPLLF